MNKTSWYTIWGGMFILCAGLGFIPAPGGFLKFLLVLLSLGFFAVPVLLVKELENSEEDLRDDVYLVESDAVELDDILIPELIMDMEMSVVCDEDCKGLCYKCGKNLNEGPCGCVTKEVDPRLAVLQKFLDNKK